MPLMGVPTVLSQFNVHDNAVKRVEDTMGEEPESVAVLYLLVAVCIGVNDRTS